MLIKQSTAKNITVLMVSSTDHISGVTGLAGSLTVYAVKNGTGGSISPTQTEVSAGSAPGVYKLALTAGMTDTLGELEIHVTGTGADPTDEWHQIVAFDPEDAVRLGLSSLPAGPMAVKKNAALAAFPFVMVDSSGNPTTGLTVTAQRRIDNGAFAACANSVTEVGNGWYSIDLAAGDLNGTTIALRFSATGARDTDQVILTQA